MFEFTATIRVKGSNVAGAQVGLTAFATTQADALANVVKYQDRMGFEIVTIAAAR